MSHSIRRALSNLRTRLIWTFMTVAFVSCSSLVYAETVTLHYRVTIVERAPLLRTGTGTVDRRIGLSRGPSEAYNATFDLTLTFDVEMGHATGVGFGTADSGLFTFYGTPRFSLLPLPRATPLVSSGDAGAERDVDGKTFEQQAFDSRTGSSYTNYGTYLNDVVRIPATVDSGSTILFTHIRPASFTGPHEFQLVPLETFLLDMRGNLDFDFVDWSLFRTSGDFTADSYNYRGTASFLPSLQELLSSLIDDVEMNLKAGISNSFDAKLDAVMGAIDDEKAQNDAAAINAMYAFINAVEAQRGKNLTDMQADSLISSAQTIIAALGG